jgi:hypothetical protein
MWHTLLALIDDGKGSNMKASIGKTGVHLHYHKSEEYNKLTKEQKNKLREWHSNNPELAKKQKKIGKSSCNKKLKNTVLKLVVKALNKKPEEMAKASEEKGTNAAISALVDMVIQKKLASVMTMMVTVASITVEPTHQQKSILASAKNVMGTPKAQFAAP